MYNLKSSSKRRNWEVVTYLKTISRRNMEIYKICRIDVSREVEVCYYDGFVEDRMTNRGIQCTLYCEDTNDGKRRMKMWTRYSVIG